MIGAGGEGLRHRLIEAPGHQSFDSRGSRGGWRWPNVLLLCDAMAATAPATPVASLILAALVLPAALARAQTADGDCPVVFEEVSDAMGVDFVHQNGAAGERHLPETMGAGVAWLDYDGDGWTDLYLVQSGEFPPVKGRGAGDRLFRNLRGRAFVDVSEATGVGDTGYGQGVVWGDLDGDRLLDLVLLRYGGDRVLEQGRDATFTASDLEAAAPATPTSWSSSAALGDLDGDGVLDLYVARYLDYELDHGLECGTAERPEYCDPSLFDGQRDRYYLSSGGSGQMGLRLAGEMPVLGSEELPGAGPRRRSRRPRR